MGLKKELWFPFPENGTGAGQKTIYNNTNRMFPFWIVADRRVIHVGGQDRNLKFRSFAAKTKLYDLNRFFKTPSSVRKPVAQAGNGDAP
jgi:hypothetical protein